MLSVNKKLKFKKPFLIAEIGINHNGSVKIAKKLIDLAKLYNFDAVKFQKRQPEISVPENQKSIIRSSPWGNITYLDYKKKIEFGEREFKEIDKYCKKKKNYLVCFSLGYRKPEISQKI